MIGQTISHYKITEKLGEGGMGVVYKAQDTKLDRPVALKFLAPHLLRDEEGRKRFEREAKAAAKLDHPNICTVYEIDEVEGRTFIVMAFLEGRPLSERIDEGPLKLTEALSIAIQMAEGLEAAHDKGITHRDIKPDNVMLMSGSRGLVKLMDFGLAQLAGSSKFTREGTTLGTVNYMSPEQAEGAPTGQATDLWSLGVVLYEMIAGEKPFRGEFDQAIVFSIMNEPAEPLTAVRTGVPKELERIVNKCLAKKPERRYHHTDELLGDLQAVRQELEPQPSRVTAQPAAAKRTSPAVMVGMAAVLLAAVGLTWWFSRPSDSGMEPPPQYKLTQVTRDSGYTGQPALSPDGKLLAYVSDRAGEGNLDLWVQQTSGGDPIQLTRTEASVSNPSFSPDGSQIVYGGFLGEGGVYVIPALGGNTRRLAERGWSPKFSPDGESITYSVGYQNATGAIYIVSSGGGQPRRLELDIPWAVWPTWSPDGEYLLFAGSTDPVPGAGSPTVDWWIAPSGGGKAVKLGVREALRKSGIRSTRTPTVGEWLADGSWVLFSASLGDSTNLWRIGISASEARITTQPQRLTSGTNEAQPTVSLDGRVGFTSARSDLDIWSLPIDPNEGKPRGPLERLIGGATQDNYPTVSDDGQKLVFVSDRSGSWDVWVKDLESSSETPITVTPENEDRAAISPDGAQVAYIRREGTQTNLYTVSVAGGNREEADRQYRQLHRLDARQPEGCLLFVRTEDPVQNRGPEDRRASRHRPASRLRRTQRGILAGWALAFAEAIDRPWAH